MISLATPIWRSAIAPVNTRMAAWAGRRQEIGLVDATGADRACGQPGQVEPDQEDDQPEQDASGQGQ